MRPFGRYAVLLLACASPLEAKEAKQRMEASFEYAAPSDWSVERKETGVVLTGAASGGVPTRVVLRYFAPGDALNPDARAYMTRLTSPSIVPLKGWKNGPVRNVRAAGRDALAIERDTSEFPPGHPRMGAREVPVKEEHIAIPAARGFYLLRYSAPRELDSRERAKFRRLVSSFKPKL